MRQIEGTMIKAEEVVLMQIEGTMVEYKVTSCRLVYQVQHTEL